MERVLAKTLLGMAFGGLLLASAINGAFAQPSLTGSEALRAERCAGDYTCDEDGSWAATDMCAARHAMVLAMSTVGDRAQQAMGNSGARASRLAQGTLRERAVTADPVAAKQPDLFATLCAARDRNIAALIEHHVEAQDIDTDRLADAFAVLALARKACAQERVREALALYDSIRLRPYLAPARH